MKRPEKTTRIFANFGLEHIFSMKKKNYIENGFQPTILCKKQLKQVLGIDEHLICFAKKNARTTLHATQIVFNFHTKKQYV